MIPVSHSVTLKKRPAASPLEPISLFALEGALLQFIMAVNGFGNNLFATALGATDSQIGLVQTVPNLAAVLLLLPVGLLADRLRSSRTIPLMSLFAMAMGFFLMAAVPMAGAWQLPLFFLALVFTVGGPVLYNAQWQNFFGDVISVNNRNHVLDIRNRFMFAVGIVAPLICGMIMNHNSGTGGALRILQIFFLLCGGAMLIQALVVSGIPCPVRKESPSVSAVSFRSSLKPLLHSRAFLLFYLPITFFYITWQADWSMWYIGQVQYLHLTEAQITAFNGIFNIGQLVAVALLAKGVQRWGSDRVLPLAAVGLMFCPLIMMACSRVPMGMRMGLFSVLVTVLNAPQCATNLCIVQILLRVAPKECRNMAVSLYTLTITLTNCFMPYLGVKLYTALGGNYRALMQFFGIVFAARALALGLLIWRCRWAKE